MCPLVFEIIDDDTDEEEESKRKLEEEIRKNNEAIFQNTVDRAQKEAEEEAETESHGFDMAEVDFGNDEEMEVDDVPEEEEEANAAMDLDEEERATLKEEADDQLPKWARRMDPSGKRIPMTGLTNCDADETAAQIIDGGIVANIILLYGRYYDNRVTISPADYHKSMVSNDKGRVDLDGICPYMSAKMKLVNSSFLTRRPSEISSTRRPHKSSGPTVTEDSMEDVHGSLCSKQFTPWKRLPK